MYVGTINYPHLVHGTWYEVLPCDDCKLFKSLKFSVWHCSPPHHDEEEWYMIPVKVPDDGVSVSSLTACTGWYSLVICINSRLAGTPRQNWLTKEDKSSVQKVPSGWQLGILPILCTWPHDSIIRNQWVKLVNHHCWLAGKLIMASRNKTGYTTPPPSSTT